MGFWNVCLWIRGTLKLGRSSHNVLLDMCTKNSGKSYDTKWTKMDCDKNFQGKTLLQLIHEVNSEDNGLCA